MAGSSARRRVLLVDTRLGCEPRDSVQLQRQRFPSYEVWAWAAFLGVAALISVGFAVFNGAFREWTWTELGRLAGYGLVAWISVARFRSKSNRPRGSCSYTS